MNTRIFFSSTVTLGVLLVLFISGCTNEEPTSVDAKSESCAVVNAPIPETSVVTNIQEKCEDSLQRNIYAMAGTEEPDELEQVAIGNNAQTAINKIYETRPASTEGAVLTYISHEDVAILNAAGSGMDNNGKVLCANGIALFKGGAGQRDDCYLESAEGLLGTHELDALELCRDSVTDEATLAAINSLTVIKPPQHELGWISKSDVALMHRLFHGGKNASYQKCSNGLPVFFQAKGTNAEHTRFTIEALQCPYTSEVYDSQYCWGTAGTSAALASLAGGNNNFGSVGNPDVIELKADNIGCDTIISCDWPIIGIVTGYNKYWHCDNGDSDKSNPNYPQTPEAAWGIMGHCFDWVKDMRDQVVTIAGGMLDANTGRILGDNDDTCGSYTATSTEPVDTAKCKAGYAFGFVLHAAMDFYSHSNYADSEDKSNAVSLTNPKGLIRDAPFSLIGPGADTNARPEDLADLVTGCYPGAGVPEDPHITPADCTNRITHDDGLAKDDMTKPRSNKGVIQDDGSEITNYTRVQEEVVREIEYQWKYLIDAIVAEYGSVKAENIICAMTKDTPSQQCSGAKLADYVYPCASDSECASGACARDNDNQVYMCCPGGRYFQEWGYFYCSNLENRDPFGRQVACYCNAQCKSKHCDGPADFGNGKCKAAGPNLGDCPSGWDCSTLPNGTRCDWGSKKLVCRRGSWTYQDDCS